MFRFLKTIPPNFSERTLCYIVIVVLIIVILFLRSCSPTPTNCPEGGKPVIVKTTDTVWVKGKDSIIYKPEKVIYIPGPETFKDVDTLAILKDYFAKRVYSDKIKIDSFGYVFLTDTVSQNQIVSRKVKLDYKIPVITNTTTITIPPKLRNQVYVGINIGGNLEQPVNYLGPNFVLKTKKDKMYNLGVGIGNGGLNYNVGTAWKIKLK